MITLIEFIILGLAVFRLSIMLADVEQMGPFGILLKLRYWAGVRFDDKSQPYGKNSFANGLLCTYCNSVWLGIVALAAFLLFGYWAIMAALPFAISGLVIAMDKR